MPRQLYFRNSEFRNGKNVTVRNGDYWNNTNVVKIKVVNTLRNYKIKTSLKKFSQLTQNILKLEHDKNCRNISGLYKELKSIYPSFTKNSIVTVIQFII